MTAQPPHDDTRRDAAGGVWRRAHARRRRFIERYEVRRAERLQGGTNPAVRAFRVTIGVLLVLLGVAIGWLPGPGFIVFAIPGTLLIASEWRRAALLMDRVEEETIPRLHRAWARIRGGPPPSWREKDPQAWATWSERRGAGIDDGRRRRHDDGD